MIYFDNAATTKPSETAIGAMMKSLTEEWGNPSSRHAIGQSARRELEGAKKTILSTLGANRASAASVIFTGSGTEATNLAILGVCRSKPRRGRIIIGAGEHSSVENAACEAEKEGFEVVRIGTHHGALDLDAFDMACTPDTVLVSLMLVNNETGALYDVSSAFAIAREKCGRVITHCDAVQGYMKVPFTVKSLDADMITVSGHKIHGPKGVGALYADGELFRHRELSPIVFGGGQEGGFRSGTENVPAILGFAAAAAEMHEKMSENIEKMAHTRSYMIDKLSGDDRIILNLPETAAPHILSVTVRGVKSETMLHYLSSCGICVSSGSACSSHSKNLSRALLAFGIGESDADETIRISFSEDNTESEADAFAAALLSGADRLARRK